MKICPNCNATNPDGAKTCQECSMPLPGSPTSNKPAPPPTYLGAHAKKRISFSHNNHSKGFKYWYIGVILMFLIGGIVAGFIFKTSDASLSEYYYRHLAEEHFNWVLMISIWLSGVIPTAILHAVYAHLENQEITIDALNAIYEQTENLNNK